MQIVRQNQEEIERCLNARGIERELERLFEKLERSLKNALDLCTRNSRKLDKEENREHWFSLLDRVLIGFEKFFNKFKEGTSQKLEALEKRLNRCIKEILESMMDCVEFQDMVGHIVREFGSVPFKYFKENFISVLSRFSYQKNILRKAIDLLNSDIKNMTQNLLILRSRGVSSSDLTCAKCRRQVAAEEMMKVSEDKLLFFICGHVYHGKCSATRECDLCAEEEKRKGSIVFDSKKKEGKKDRY
mmetsp:Transcript_10777/g.21069  ORF Transcript_10777/g.21069 Transcript_10777/m.21069 type:complete len:245 (-) Transcript_10777:44-778(-)